MLKHLTFSISIAFISWLVGMIINAMLSKTAFYQKLSNFNFIPSKTINRNLGIGAFKWIVKNTPFKFFNQKLKASTKIGVPELKTLRKEMTIAEISHLIGFGFVTLFAAAKILNGAFLFALIMMMVNTLMNLYPSLLQQENKRRIDRFLIIKK